MHFTSSFLLSVATLLPFVSRGQAAYNNTGTHYLTRMIDDFFATSPRLQFSYDSACIGKGIGLAATLKGVNTTKYLDLRQKILNNYTDPVPVCPIRGYSTLPCNYNATYYSLDQVSIGRELLLQHRRFPNETKYEYWMEVLRTQLNNQPRNNEGGFWHRSNYVRQMWLDGLWMAEPFYSEYTHYYQPTNLTAWNDIALQFDLLYAHVRNATTGLLAHGYDEKRTEVWADPVTGSAPLVWCRALGWYAVALVDVLDNYPPLLPGAFRLRRHLLEVVEAISKVQHSSGGWYLVMNEPYPSDPRNYIESSATAMFTTAILKGIRKGYLPYKYKKVATKAWNLLTSKFAVVNNATGLLQFDGTVSVGSLGGNGTFEYYLSVPVVTNDQKGLGAFLWAAYEWAVAI